MAIRIEYEEEKRPIKIVRFGGDDFWALMPLQNGTGWTCVLCQEKAALVTFSKDSLRELRDACNIILGEE